MKVLLGRMRVTCVLAALMIVATWGSEVEISHGADIEVRSEETGNGGTFAAGMLNRLM